MRGTIVKGVAGFYYVKCEGAVYQCKARGVFKNEGITPLVGDQVVFEPGAGQEDDGLITEIEKRKNQFIRPPVANVDCFAVVIAAAHPKPNLAVADKFLVMAEKYHTDVVFCLNKTDLAKGGIMETIKSIYEPIYPVVYLNAARQEGIEELRALISGKRTALAGPSGVGKSTILNGLLPGALAQTGDISRKTKRGRHTTRHCELFDLGGETMLFDTPGFTSFDILEAEEEELALLYPEMRSFAGKCKFDNCRHMKEPDCAVRQAVDEGEITARRYESYKTQITEIQSKKKY